MSSIADSKDASEIERLGHVCGKVTELWGKPQFGDYVHQLVFDSRDGARKGLPPTAAEDLMLLVEVNKDVRAMKLAEKTGLSLRQAYEKIDEMDRVQHHGDALDNPLVSRDTVIHPKDALRQARATERAKALAPTPARHGSMRQPERSAIDVLLALVTSKWLLAAVVLAFVIRTFWPALRPLLGLP